MTIECDGRVSYRESVELEFPERNYIHSVTMLGYKPGRGGTFIYATFCKPNLIDRIKGYTHGRCTFTLGPIKLEAGEKMEIIEEGKWITGS
jgi:hypothetical protein